MCATTSWSRTRADTPHSPSKSVWVAVVGQFGRTTSVRCQGELQAKHGARASLGNVRGVVRVLVGDGASASVAWPSGRVKSSAARAPLRTPPRSLCLVVQMLDAWQRMLAVMPRNLRKRASGRAYLSRRETCCCCFCVSQ